MELQELKILADNIRNKNPNAKKVFWSDKFKEQTLDLLIKGHSANLIFKTTGIPVSTIYKWKYSSSKNQKKLFKKIKVTNKEPQDLSLSWDSGLSIKCLTFFQLKELLKEGLL